MVTDRVRPENATDRDEALHRFVRERRRRLAADSRFIGGSPRLPNRIGKVVTQEEIAEYLGISRQWYIRFECGAAAGFSIQLVSRLCELLALSAAERAELMMLAMPELPCLIRRDIEERRDVGESPKDTVHEHFISAGRAYRYADDY